MSPDLYVAIVRAERAARHAHDLAYAENAPFVTRWSLGRAQSILMHYVVSRASEHPDVLQSMSRYS
jgi:hypothetical protein